MSQLRIVPITLVAAVALLGVGICDICDPESRVNAATVPAEAGAAMDRGGSAAD